MPGRKARGVSRAPGDTSPGVDRAPGDSSRVGNRRPGRTTRRVRVPGSVARGIAAAVATVAVTATVVAAGTGALIVYRSATTAGAAAPLPSVRARYAPSPATSNPGGPRTATPSPTPSAKPTPRDTRLSVRAARTCPSASSLSLRAALAQTLMIGVSGQNTSGPRGITDGPTPVGGIFLYENDADLALRSGILPQISHQTPPPLVAVDDEGGRVQRVESLFGSMPSARAQGSMEPAALRALAAKRARQLSSVGVTLNFAPVLDLGGGAAGTVGDRAFATSPEDVAVSGAAFAAGMRDGGVLPALGHFPGLGRARGDAATTIPTAPALASLRGNDLIPYQRVLADGPSAVLVGNVTVPGLSSRPDLPATLDPATYRLLRHDLGLRGLAITSDLSTNAAIRQKYSTPAATIAALAAGADLVVLNHPGYLEPLLDSLTTAVRSGALPESRVREAAARVLAAKGCRA